MRNENKKEHLITTQGPNKNALRWVINNLCGMEKNFMGNSSFLKILKGSDTNFTTWASSRTHAGGRFLQLRLRMNGIFKTSCSLHRLTEHGGKDVCA